MLRYKYVCRRCVSLKGLVRNVCDTAPDLALESDDLRRL